MTSVLRLGVYRERIEKYGAGGSGCRRQGAQPQQQVTGSNYTETTRTTFPASKANNNSDIPDQKISGTVHDETYDAAPTLTSSPDGRTTHRAQPAVCDQGGKPGKGK